MQPVTLRKIVPPSLGQWEEASSGGVLGNMVGGGRGKTLATIAGAALGAAGGYAGEKALTKQNGLEITVELENGQQLSIVQAADQQFSPGERVRVLRGSDGSARVTR
ncbi:MAG: glycine zipper 2TM domain-containing protein [Bilophila wadsworthia]